MSVADPSYFDTGREDLYSEYASALRNGGLVIQRCPSCSISYSPPVLRCGSCGVTDLHFLNALIGTAVAVFTGSRGGAATVIIEVEGCRVAALTEDDSVTAGAIVERVNVRDDDRAPRVGLVMLTSQSGI